MRFLHLSDLHLGKRVCEFSMLDDQRYILEEILSLLDTRPVDAVLLAGDLYDKPVPPPKPSVCWTGSSPNWPTGSCRSSPSAETTTPPSGSRSVPICWRGARSTSARCSKESRPHPLTDAYGPVDIYLLPFLKPATVRHIYPDEPIESYSDALGCVLRRCAPDPARRSVLVAHQFVAGATACESEEPSVGGLDCVDAALFDGFDYVALGHLHSPRRWAATPCATAAPR